MPPSVAKALLKPAIVGAQGATSHIRDGLDIAVDCAHGQRPVPPGIRSGPLWNALPVSAWNHTTLQRGMYLSRQDGDVLTWDIRMKRPNQGDYLSTGAAHTLEHLFATYARNSAWSSGVIYVGPMGLPHRLLSPDPGADPRPGAGAGGGVFPLHGRLPGGHPPAPARPNAATTATWTCPPPGPRPPPCCPCWRPSPADQLHY